ncbi:MAG: trigger factor [Eubacteriales bacterium]|nr:trigger factor [Clostridiales bacterium]MDY3941074.1 trigger factor [Eubacteriales bacterium]
MSKKSIDSIAANQYKLVFDVDRPTFEAAINKVFKKQNKNITIPGFRKGHAPRAIVEKMYGKEVFYEDAINEIIPGAYTEAMEGFDKTVVSRPEFDVETIDDNGVTLTATFFVKPDAEIADYLGIPVERDEKEATDAEVDEELSRVQQRNSRMIEVTDRPAQIGDSANIDFEGTIDGVPFEGGKAEGHTLKLGSGQFIPGFEDQIVGHNVGDTFDVTVTFPEDYHADELKGKEAVFHCKLNGLEYNELPVLDDDFAKDVSEFDTLDAYKADIKAKIAERHKKEADNAVEEQLIKALGEKLVCDIPECMFENEVENFVRDYDNRLRMQGLDLSTYFQYTGMNLDTLRKNMRPDAERQVKTRLALEKIAALENLEATAEEIEAEYARLAEAYNMEADKIKAAVAADAIADDLKVKKAIDLVKEKAIVTAKAPESTEAE